MRLPITFAKMYLYNDTFSLKYSKHLVFSARLSGLQYRKLGKFNELFQVDILEAMNGDEKQ